MLDTSLQSWARPPPSPAQLSPPPHSPPPLPAAPLPLDPLPLTIDCSAPIGGVVQLGADNLSAILAGTPYCVAADMPAYVSWKGFEEQLTPPISYFWTARVWTDVLAAEAATAACNVTTVHTSSGCTNASTPTTPTPPIAWPSVAAGRNQWATFNVSAAFGQGGVEGERPLPHAPETLALLVRACNRIGSCADWIRSASPMAIVSAPPQYGAASFAISTGRFLNNATFVRGSFKFTDPSAANVGLLIDACLGTTPHGCQAVGLHRIEAGAPLGAFLFEMLDLTCGADYYLTVRATNCAGLTSTVHSDGATLCCHAPTGGFIRLLGPQGDSVRYVTGQREVSVAWGGFVERCSGIEAFELSLSIVGNSSATVWTSGPISSNAAAYLPLPSNLLQSLPSAHYELAVLATSGAGLASRVSTTLVIERTPPIVEPPQFRFDLSNESWQTASPSTNDSRLGSPVCMPVGALFTEVRVNAADKESGIQSYALGLRTIELAADIYSGNVRWIMLGLSSLARLTPSDLIPLDSQGNDAQQTAIGTTLVLRACNAAGLCSESAQTAPILRVSRAPSSGQVDVSNASRALPEAEHTAWSSRPRTSLQTGFVPPSLSRGFYSPLWSVTATWNYFIPAGCPTRCGGKPCFYDPSCATDPPRRGGMGCDAAGIGQLCRFCGFGAFEECPPFATRTAGAPGEQAASADNAYEPNETMSGGGYDDVYGSGETVPDGGYGEGQGSNASHANLSTGVIAVRTLSMEVCMGSTAFGCQTVPRQAVPAGVSSWELPSFGAMANASHPCGVVFYVTATATNCAGLSRSVASEGRRLCCTAPTLPSMELLAPSGNLLPRREGLRPDSSEVIVARNRTWSNFTLGRMTWTPAEESCSGVREYQVLLLLPPDGGTSQVAAWTSAVLGATATSLALPPGLLDELPHSSHFDVLVRVTSHAGLWSEAIQRLVIDDTPPTQPKDLSLFVRWAGSQVTELTPPNDGVVTPATPGGPAQLMCVPGSAPVIELSWDLVGDADSGTTYNVTAWYAPSSPRSAEAAQLSWRRMDLEDLFWRTNATSLILRTTLLHGANRTGFYTFSVIGCNPLGMCTDAMSRPLHVVPHTSLPGCPASDAPSPPSSPLDPLDLTSLFNGSNLSLPDLALATSFTPQPSPSSQSSTTFAACTVIISPTDGASDGFLGWDPQLNPSASLRTSWVKFSSGTAVDTYVDYASCLGRTARGCDTPFVEYARSTNRSYQFAGLACGATYYLTVKARNCGGHLNTAVSSGVTLCCRAPTLGNVELHPLHAANATRFGQTTVYVNSGSRVAVSWDGFFEQCAGVREYRVSIRRADPSSPDELWGSRVLMAGRVSNRSLIIPAEAVDALPGAEGGAEYLVAVHATNHAGLTSSATATLVVDRTPPTVLPHPISLLLEHASHSVLPHCALPC
jgi:hypothetical protein